MKKNMRDIRSIKKLTSSETEKILNFLTSECLHFTDEEIFLRCDLSRGTVNEDFYKRVLYLRNFLKVSLNIYNPLWDNNK